MWPAIAAIISSILGFGAGLVGFNNSTNIYNLPQATPTPYFRACYNPRENIKIALKWPDNFINVPDQRPTLNPARFSNLPDSFSSSGDPNGDGIADCKALIMNSATADSTQPVVERTYIQVRSDVRIASCKTDELAGPLAEGLCPETENEDISSVRHRGSCDLTKYTDLRKVAQIQDDGQEKEIFWNPFSYNVGCDYTQDQNCGPGDRQNVNLKDFIYVLKKRDAFDNRSRPNCPALWDAGSTNESGCSHYFDVYMAEDLYKNPNDFVKQVLQNCTEQSHFTPLPDSVLWIPPSFIRLPFLNQSQGNSPLPDKINPYSLDERNNYSKYIWSNPAIFKSDKTNLVKITENQDPITLCLSGTVNSGCYDPIGTIDFRNESSLAESFSVYSQVNAPQTFILVKTTDPAVKHVYMITEKELPANTRRDPTLQLRNMEFISQNQWTWATPWCKPAIYLYPKTPISLNIKLNLNGQLTYSDPPYIDKLGWQVFANPNGQILTTSDQRPATNYPYLYYEADINDVQIPKEGFVWTKNEIQNNLTPILHQIGFNKKEIADFFDYWNPKLQEKPFYFVTFLPIDKINQKEELIFSVKPDSLIRTRVVFEGLNAPISVFPPKTLPSNQRLGFTVTDWGGTIIGKSCSDISVE